MKRLYRQAHTSLIMAMAILLYFGLRLFLRMCLLLKRSAEKSPEKPKSPAIDATIFNKGPVNLWVNSQGTVQPTNGATVISAVAGRVVFLSPHFVLGGYFSKGEPLLRLAAAPHTTVRAGIALARRTSWLRAALLLGRATATALKPAGKKPRLTEVTAPINGIVKALEVSHEQDIGAGQALVSFLAVDEAEIRLPLRTEDLVCFAPELFRGNLSSALRPQVRLQARIGGKTYFRFGEIVRSEGVNHQRIRQIYLVARIRDPYSFNDPGQPALPFGTYVRAIVASRNCHCQTQPALWRRYPSLNALNLRRFSLPSPRRCGQLPFRTRPSAIADN